MVLKKFSGHVTIVKWFLSCDLITCDTVNHMKVLLHLPSQVMKTIKSFIHPSTIRSQTKNKISDSFHILCHIEVHIWKEGILLVTNLSNEQDGRKSKDVWKGGKNFSSCSSLLSTWNHHPFLSVSGNDYKICSWDFSSDFSQEVIKWTCERNRKEDAGWEEDRTFARVSEAVSIEEEASYWKERWEGRGKERKWKDLAVITFNLVSTRNLCNRSYSDGKHFSFSKLQIHFSASLSLLSPSRSPFDSMKSNAEAGSRIWTDTIIQVESGESEYATSPTLKLSWRFIFRTRERVSQ